MITNTPFAIKVYQDSFPEYDAHKQAVLDALENFRNNNPSVTRSNNGGYQSPATLGTVAEMQPIFKTIADTAGIALADFNIPFQRIEFESAWLNVNRGQGSHNQVHIHDGILSGVFYISAPPGSGQLHIMNPGMNVLWQGHQRTHSPNEHTAEVAHITPRDGDFYLWPSYIPHSVDTNSQQDCERVSISFNISVA